MNQSSSINSRLLNLFASFLTTTTTFFEVLSSWSSSSAAAVACLFSVWQSFLRPRVAAKSSSRAAGKLRLNSFNSCSNRSCLRRCSRKHASFSCALLLRNSSNVCLMSFELARAVSWQRNRQNRLENEFTIKCTLNSEFFTKNKLLGNGFGQTVRFPQEIYLARAQERREQIFLLIGELNPQELSF